MPFDNPDQRSEFWINHQDEVDLIAEMRQLLRTPSNWVKGYERRHGRFCLLGAIEEVRRDWPAYHHQLIADQVWGRLTEIVKSNPIDFNDADDTRHRDILAALTKAQASFE